VASSCPNAEARHALSRSDGLATAAEKQRRSEGVGAGRAFMMCLRWLACCRPS